MKHKIVLIGFGRFGQVMHHAFSQNWQQYMQDKHNLQVDLELVVVPSANHPIFDARVKQLPLNEALIEADLVIPCMQISKFEQVVTNIASLLEHTKHANMVIADVCSVKTYPAEVMLKELPDDVGIVATHPMWGPDSTKGGTQMAGLKFIYKVLHHNKSDMVEYFVNFWKYLEQEVIEMTPEAHDREAAYTHAFAFLVGKIGMLMDIRKNHISTKGFEGLLYNQMAVENDTGELFNNMFTYNPYAREMLETFGLKLVQIKQDLYGSAVS